MFRCPGQDQRFWKAADIFEVKCPACGYMVEFFKDEPQLTCPKCKQVIINPKIDIGCAEWCKYASQCLRVSEGEVSRILCDRLIDEMKKVFTGDQKRVNHAIEVLKYADMIQPFEGGNPLVARAAAILHEIDVSVDNNTISTENLQSAQILNITRKILMKFEIDDELIERICRTILNQHAQTNTDIAEYKILRDAHWLATAADELINSDKETRKKLITAALMTTKGRQVATDMYINKA